jgi:4-hydroxybenzoate polyprenyltransferase
VTGRVGPFLKLTRFPLVFTAVADSAAGYLVTLPQGQPVDFTVLALLAATSASLYACGMVFNDVADYWRDKVLHRERPLPSGAITTLAARRFGLVLVFAAAVFGSLVNFQTGQGVLAVFVLIMFYNFYAKTFAISGAVAMGLVRSANFLLGVLAVAPPERGLIVLPPWDRGGYAQALVLGGYVFFLTLMSTLEERSMSRGLFTVCGLAMSAAPAVGLTLARAPSREQLVAAGALSIALSVALVAHTLASLRALTREAVMRNVRWGVLAIIVVDATFVTARAGWRAGAGVLALAVPALVLLPLFRRL